MSKELPVWNQDETDVLPQYHLSFGHVIFPTGIDGESVIKTLGTWEEMTVGYLKESSLPLTDEKHFGFAEGNEDHFLVLNDGSSTFVFADRRYFLRNEMWLRVSKKQRVPTIVCFQVDEGTFFYDFIEGGSVVAQMASEHGRVRVVGPLSVQVRVNSELVFSSKASDVSNRSFAEVVQQDVCLVNQAGKVALVRTVTGEHIASDRCKHIIAKRLLGLGGVRGALMRFFNRK